MSLFRPTLEIIDAMPGAGKTHFFIQMAKSLLFDPNPKYKLLYVAPTKALLVEVALRITGNIRRPKLPGSKSVGSYERNKIHCVWYNDDPEEIINQQELSVLKRTNFSFSRDVKITKTLSNMLETDEVCQVGDIILTTYTAFLRTNPVTEEEPTRKIWVFFDEARRCLGLRKKIYTSLGCLPSIIEAYSPIIHSKSEPDGLVALRFRKPLPTNLSKKLITDLGSSSASAIKYLQTCDYTRTTQYLVLDTKKLNIIYKKIGEDTYKIRSMGLKYRNSNSGVTGFPIYPFMKPNHLFDGYERVTVLSAYFAHSQMYHMLKQDNYRMINMVTPRAKDRQLIEDSPQLLSVYKKFSPILRERSRTLRDSLEKRLHLVPILYKEDDDISGKVHKRNLTKYLLTRGIIVERSVLRKAKELVAASGVKLSSQDVTLGLWNQYWSVHNKNRGSRLSESMYRAAKKDTKFNLYDQLLKLIQPYMVTKSGDILTPLRVLLRESLLRLSKIRPLYLISGQLLTVINSESGECPYMPPRDGYTTWTEALVEDCLYTERSRSRNFNMNIVSGPYLNGLNSWIEGRMLVHLAALNPKPEEIRLYAKALPTYNPEYDYLLDNLMQSVYRTNLRMPEGTDPVYMVLSHEEVAIALNEMMGTNLTVIKNSNKDLVELRLSTTNRRLKEGYQPEARKLCVFRSRYRKYIARGKSEYRIKLQEVETRLRELGWSPRKIG